MTSVLWSCKAIFPVLNLPKSGAYVASGRLLPRANFDLDTSLSHSGPDRGYVKASSPLNFTVPKLLTWSILITTWFQFPWPLNFKFGLSVLTRSKSDGAYSRSEPAYPLSLSKICISGPVENAENSGICFTP